MCLIDRVINLLSLRASIAAFWATSLTLNGGLIKFNAVIIFFDPYPHPTLNEASPKILENLL